MATTATSNGKVINVTFASIVGDFDLQTFFQNRQDWLQAGVKVRKIVMIPAATDDVLVVRDAPAGANTTSEQVADFKATSDYSRPEQDFGPDGMLMFPAVDSTEVTAGVKMRIELA